MIVHFMRHGETTGDVEERYGGDYEDHLTERGKEQVHERIPFFEGKHVQRIFTSPRIRAQESAAILSSTLHVKSEVMDGWRERNAYGILTGVKKSIAKRTHPEVVRLLQDYRNTAPGAESYEELKMRLAATLDILAHEPYEEVIVITHSGPIICMLREYIRNEPKKIRDTAVMTVELSVDSKLKLLATDNIEF